jgi:phospholipid/cholesterol/gamma-HCH transport system substrate-binding protein
MLRRSTKVQLILFVVITLLGISYVSAKYVGLAKYVTGDNGCKVSADFKDSGGIFTNAEVTYRGVTVGKVGALNLIPDGIRVDLQLDNCSSPKIPANSVAIVADRSVIGEQYVNLVVPNNVTPSSERVTGNSRVGNITENQIPTAAQTLLVNLDNLVNSLPLDDLRTTVSELGKATRGRGDDLQNLLDATNTLLKAADEPSNVNATIALISEASTVLQTQLDEAQPLQSFTHSLNLLSQQLKTSDPDIRHLLSTGPKDLATVQSFVTDNRTDLGVTLANLATVGNLLVRHLPGLEEVLELYPALAAGGPSALHDQYGALGLVLQVNPTPQDCGDVAKGRQGYGGTQIRNPTGAGAGTAIAPNVAARCTASPSGPDATNVRGSANVPGGDPVSVSGGGYAYPRPVTDNVTAPKAGDTVQVGPSLSSSAALGDGSWLGLVTASLH